MIIKIHLDSLNKNLIEPLLDWKFITESKISSHNIISLTGGQKTSFVIC
jgi:hypothetical protein